MRTFILAAIAATATAMYDNEVTLFTDISVANDAKTYGSVSAMTGWKKNGEGSDATLDLMLKLETKNIRDSMINYMVSSDATWFMGISKDETTAETEVQKISFAISGERSIVTLAYGKVDKNAKDITTPKAETYGDSFTAELLAEGTSNSPSQANPVGFWSIDPSSSSFDATTWTIGMTRALAGVADITTGAERPGYLAYNW